MSILLTIEESSDELVVGIPRYVTISSSQPSTIYYTMDGSEPNESSLIASGKVFLPTIEGSVTLRYRAFYQGGFTDTYEEVYTVSSEYFTESQSNGETGINIFEGTESILYYYNSDGEQLEASKVPFEDLEIKTSRTDSNGEDVGSSKSFINFVDKQFGYSYPDKSETSDINFDKDANMVIIDGSSPEKVEGQQIQIVNRPYGNLSPRSSFYIESYDRESNYLGGNLVNYQYNPRTGDLVCYYFDSRENRWVKSIQKTDKKSFDFSKVSGTKNTRVFDWIKDPVGSRLR